jgi:hypothetical protein
MKLTMHDPKFEKEVQQKMGELEFSPSESVWANIEKAVNKRRTRRGLPLFWRFALPGLLLLAGGGYYFFREGSTPVTPAAPVAETAATHPIGEPRKAAESTGTSASAGTPASTEAHPVTPQPHVTSTGGSHEGVATAATLAAAGTGTSRTHSRDRFAATAERQGYTTKIQRAGRSAGSDDKTAVDPVDPVESQSNDRLTDAAGNRAPGSQQVIFSFTPGLADLTVHSGAIYAGKLSVKSKESSAVKTLQSSRRPWEAAFSGGAGISSLHQTQVSNYSLPSYSPASTTATRSVTSNAARPDKQYVSTVSPGASFWVGVLAQKPLSARWNLSVGLDLRYYSTRVRVGQQVTNYVPAAATLLTSSAVAPIQSYPYFSTGNEQAYTNRYYFLELPVAIEWKINHSHLLPLFWDGGFSVSYLMGSSAVYYNTHSGVYFKDGGVANRTQFNLSTALMVGLPFHGIRIQAGPQVQYGLTPLLNTQLSGEQHIFYGGIRLVVLPGKK